MHEHFQNSEKMDAVKNPYIAGLKGRVQNNLSGFLRVLLVAWLVFLQVGLILVLPFMLKTFTVYIYIVLEIASAIVILKLVNESGSPSYKIAWICIVLILPISGHLMYILWGKSGTKNKLNRKIMSIIQEGHKYAKETTDVQEFYRKRPQQARMSKYLSEEGFPLYKNNHITYFSMAEDAFEKMFEDIDSAKHFILINFFIVAEGGLWDQMHEILLRKRKEGVEIKFMYDDFGASIRTGKYFSQRLMEEGIEVRIFNPIHKYTDKLYMNFRSHQKIVVIDGNIGYTGGFNLADEYANLVQRFGVWKDNGIRIEGEGVYGMTQTFLSMWEVCGLKSELDYSRYMPTKQFSENDVYCHMVYDGPANNPSNPIENLYQQMIDRAESYVYIMTPYLIIEKNLVDALTTAAQSGVDVRIITPGIPDKKGVKRLTEYNYGELLKYGVRIFEYEPGFVHAKTIINESSGIVGTANMDYRSFYLHYENVVWISDQGTVNTIRDDFDKTLKECREISLEEWRNRPIYLKLYQHVLNLFATLM